MRSKSIIPALIICLLFCSNAFSQRIWKDEIPPEYNCQGCILVIIKKEPDLNKNMHHINEMMEKRFIKNYEGKNVFVTAKDLDTNSLYADTSIYRFVLDSHTYGVSGSQTVDKGAGRSGEFNYTMSALNMHLYDRLKKKQYLQLANWPSWPKNMEKIAEALNKLLKK